MSWVENNNESMNEKLYYPDELAAELGRSRVYIYAMKKAGFVMPGGSATLEEAREWLRRNPHFRTTQYIQKGRNLQVTTV